jgi:Fe-S cluster biogenesis protein NfuA
MTSGKQSAIEARLRAAIDGLRPLLPFGDTRVELLEFQGATGVAVVRVAGDCPDCDLSALALLQGIEAHIKQRVPEVRSVRAESPPVRKKAHA